jgi:hypothetical protein
MQCGFVVGAHSGNFGSFAIFAAIRCSSSREQF